MTDKESLRLGADPVRQQGDALEVLGARELDGVIKQVTGSLQGNQYNDGGGGRQDVVPTWLLRDASTCMRYSTGAGPGERDTASGKYMRYS